jgi:hypothetical protein
LRAGAFRRAGFFELFFLAMEFLPGLALPKPREEAVVNALYDL